MQGWRWDCSDCRLRGNTGWECRLSDGAFKDFGKVNDGLFLGVAELGNGAAGAGLVRASVRARAAIMAASMEDVVGTGHWCGKNCTVLAVRSALVLGT